MFSQTAEYALRVVAHLASLGGQPATTKELAAATRIPEGYLAKVVRSLNRNHLVISQRGLHGGSTLARPPEEITVYDVVNAVTPLPRIRTCPLGIRSHGTTLCPLHRKLDDAVALVERTFKDSTMADLMQEPSRSKPLCDVSELRGSSPKGKLAAGPVRLTVSRQSR
ncbi:MAG TPA: Rrf2 family transcriptional regulator [Tepidisphaeraceae bacterium]|nr:Rrf2 family transcriptional regulator [Tepidisphaeraceae bacterium]